MQPAILTGGIRQGFRVWTPGLYVPKMEYFDLKVETRLETYADTAVVEKEGNASFIAAVRFGGYPESVKGMSDAIYGGGSVTVEIDGEPVSLCSRTKQYRREQSMLIIRLLLRQSSVRKKDSGKKQGMMRHRHYIMRIGMPR